MKTRRSPSPPQPEATPSTQAAYTTQWAWHYRTLLALRNYLQREPGDREREPYEAMEPPSLHAEDFIDECYDRTLAKALPPDPATALAEIEAALARIKAGTFGRDEKTARRIPVSLLRAKPWRRFAS